MKHANDVGRRRLNARKRDFRVICDCQRHAQREKSVVRRAMRVASRGVAVLVTLPLAFAAFDVPTSAMSFDLRAAKNAILQIEKKSPSRQFPIFTTRAVREQFLEAPPLMPPTLEVFKEEYFRRHIPFGEIIVREARRNNLPPELVAAMVQTESDFRPGLVSHKSAQGLMQIVPETARVLGIRDPFDPAQNIAAGTKYYRYLLDRFSDQSVALAAYNAGPGNVSRFGGVPPFGETRDYIARVNRRTHRYRQRVHNNYLATLRVTRASAAAIAD
jgi:soluble lytic murein transglycosylase-like protein